MSGTAIASARARSTDATRVTGIGLVELLLVLWRPDILDHLRTQPYLPDPHRSDDLTATPTTSTPTTRDR